MQLFLKSMTRSSALLPATSRTVLVELDTPGTLFFLQFSAGLWDAGDTEFEDGKLHLFLEEHGDDILDVKLGDLVTYGVKADTIGLLPPNIFFMVDIGSGVSQRYAFCFMGALTTDYLRFEYEPTDPSAVLVHADFAMIRVEEEDASAAKIEAYKELLEQVKLLRSSVPAAMAAR